MCAGAALCLILSVAFPSQPHLSPSPLSPLLSSSSFHLLNPRSTSLHSSLLASFNHSIHSLGGSFCYHFYHNISSLNACSGASSKVFLTSRLEKNFILPNDFILYLSDPHRSTSPKENSELFQSHRIWSYQRFSAQRLVRLGIKAKFMPTVSPLATPPPLNSMEQISSALKIYVLGKCDPRICSQIHQLRSNKINPILLLGSDSRLRFCRHCPTDIPTMRLHSLTKAFNFSSSILLCHNLSPSPFASTTEGDDHESLTSNDLFWIQYFLFHGGTVICHSSLEYEFNLFLYRQNILFSPDLMTLSPSSLLSLLQSHRSSSSLNPLSLLTSFLRCELFATNHTFTSNVNPHAENPSLPLTLSGTLVTQSKAHMEAFSNLFLPPSAFRVLAIMAGFNEGDVLYSSVMNLIQQGCHVHYLDNWSTDNTQTVLQRIQSSHPLLFSHEVFPPEAPPLTFNWEDILTKKKILSETLSFDWIIHVDPDEIRESPWGQKISLRQSIFVADQLGYNVINFAKVVIFHPVKSSQQRGEEKIFQPGDDLMQSFQHFELNSFHGNNFQLKAWKTYSTTPFHNISLPPQLSRPVFFDLVTYGGHAGKYINQQSPKAPQALAYVPQTKVFPLKFILRHYPFRSEEHGRQKVFQERKGRWNQQERKEYGWHIQYDQIYEDHVFVRPNTTGLLSLGPNNELPTHLYETILPCPESQPEP